MQVKGIRHLTWQEVITVRCNSASRWATEAATLDVTQDPASVLRAVRLAQEDLEVAVARLLSSVELETLKQRKGDSKGH